MGRIIHFPNQQERIILKQQKFVQKRQKVANKFSAFAKMCFSKLSYFLRLTIANILHFITVFLFGLIYEFRKLALIFLCIACVFNYYTLHGVLMTKDNLLVPFFIVVSLIAFLGKRIVSKLHIKMPFHYLLQCKRHSKEMETDENKEYVILEKID